MTRTHTCDRCDAPCNAPEDEFEECLCKACSDRFTEASRRLLNDLFFGGDPLGWMK